MPIRFGLAVGATLSRRSVFARKNYFYPDLPKGYQISQYELPIVQGGSLTIHAEGGAKTIRITRAHLEEDAGKSLHEDFRGMSGIDLNRAGTPLLEIVTEPDMRGAKEAVAYARALHALVTWIEHLRRQHAGRLVPLRRQRLGAQGRGPAARHAVRNQEPELVPLHGAALSSTRCGARSSCSKDGGKVIQETRLFDPERDETRPMRTKEDAQDYRYFPDPDLLPLVLSEGEIESIRATLPELPKARRERFAAEYHLSEYNAAALTAGKATADYFERAVAGTERKQGAAPQERAKLVANWVTVDLAAKLNADDLAIELSPVGPERLAKLLSRIQDQTLSNKMAKEVFDAMWAGEGEPDAIIARKGLRQISDAAAIEKLVDKVLAANARQVEDYRAGKQKAFNALVGQVMKATGGRANPAQVNDLLRRKLG